METPCFRQLGHSQLHTNWLCYLGKSLIQLSGNVTKSQEYRSILLSVLGLTLVPALMFWIFLHLLPRKRLFHPVLFWVSPKTHVIPCCLRSHRAFILPDWKSQKDSEAPLSESVFILKIKIKHDFALLLDRRFLSSLRWPKDTCIMLFQSIICFIQVYSLSFSLPTSFSNFSTVLERFH